MKLALVLMAYMALFFALGFIGPYAFPDRLRVNPFVVAAVALFLFSPALFGGMWIAISLRTP